MRFSPRMLILFGFAIWAISWTVLAVDVSVTGDPTVVSGEDCSDSDLPTYRFQTNAEVNGEPVDILLTVLGEDNDWTGGCVYAETSDDEITGRIAVNLRDADQDDGDNAAWIALKLQLVRQGTDDVVTPQRLQLTFLDLDSYTDSSDSTLRTDSDDVYLKVTGTKYAPYLSESTRVTLADSSIDGYDLKLDGWYSGSTSQCEQEDPECFASVVYLNQGEVYFRVQNDNAYGEADPDEYPPSSSRDQDDLYRLVTISLKVDDLEATLDYEDSGDAPSSYGEAQLGATSRVLLGEGLPPDPNSDGTGGANADADDTDSDDGRYFDDEDAVTLNGADFQDQRLEPGQAYTLQVATYNENGQTGYLNVWVDWNRDGDFADANEHVVNNREVTSSGRGTEEVTLSVPDDTQGKTYMRVMYSVSSVNSPSPSDLVEGEVEDYAFWVSCWPDVSGYVYEDVNGDGSLDDGQPASGVAVKLYRDDGDGALDAEDSLEQTMATGDDGGYGFRDLEEGTYWVVVDSRSIPPSAGFNDGFEQAGVWAEQTYGAAGDWGGALCDTDGNPDSDPQQLTSSGPCFGGRYGNRSDDASSLTGAEHVAKVVVGSEDVSGVDFGFSFNVVTNVNDQDDDPDHARTCQGCLRQFIQNANAIRGANAMRFVPAVPTNAGSGEGSRWWQIVVNGNDLGGLPAITDDNTAINGAAYDYTDGTSTRDTNEGGISAPGPVGVSQTTLDDYAKLELEINVNDAGVGLAVAASNAQIARLALYNSEAAYTAALIQVTSGSSNEVYDSFLGARADGSDPQGDDQARAGVTVKPDGQMDVRHNYIAHLYNTGVELQGTGVVEENLIEHIGMVSYCGDGVSFEGGPQRSRDDVKVQYNYIHDIAAYGVESWRAPGAYYIYENTITDTGKGDREGNYCGGTSGDINTTERGGIRIFGTGSLVERNVVYGVPGHAIVVVPVDSDTPSLQNTITQNSTYHNGGLSIDLDQGDGSGNPNGDGVTPNDGAASSSQQNNGMDYPIFTSAVVSGSQLRVQGYVGTDSGRLSGTYTIEVYKADDDGNNNGEVEEDDGLSVPHGEGRWYMGSCTTKLDGSFDCLLDLSSLSGDAVPGSGDAITGTATDGDGNTSEFGANKSVFVVEESSYAGEIVINEVLYRQTANSADENDEFIEIYNAGDGVVNLEGWRLGDGNVPLGTTDGVSYQFPSVTLGPGEYAVIWVGNQYDARQDAAGAAFQAWLGYAPKLNNTGDDVQLFDAEGNAVDYVAYGSGSAVDPPPIANFWDDTYQSGLAGASLGQSISLTPNGVDGDTSACWEKTTSGDADGRCSGYLPTVDSDDYGSRVTSVGANNNGLVGVTVGGYVYHDLEPDGTRGGGESWSDGPAVYVKLVRDGAVVQVVAVAADSDGAYAFTAVAPGDYTLVVDDNNDTGDVSPNAPAGWLFVNPPDGSRTVTAGTADVSGVDFGLFHGARVLGTVFRDTGDGAGAANDAVQNGDEPGVAGVSVTASDGANARTVQTGVEGDYTIYIPADWGSVTLSHALRPASGRNVNGSSVYQVASWQEATATDSSAARFDLGSASGLAGQELVGYNFGAVFASAFRPDQSGSATSPGAVTYAHTYQPGTQGTAELSREGGDYSYQVRVDQNCDGDFEDSGEDWQAVSPGENPTFNVDDGWPRNPDGSFWACGVEVRVLVPDGEPEGAVDIAQVTAALRWVSSANVADSREVVDTTTVRTLGTLQLEKQVRNVTQNSDFGNQVEGKPGDVLEYCISYRNIGSENVTDVVISDPIPFFSDFLYGAYTSNTDILWYDASGSNQNLTADPSDGDAGKVESGIVSVTAESTLEPGQGGKVCYQVKIR